MHICAQIYLHVLRKDGIFIKESILTAHVITSRTIQFDVTREETNIITQLFILLISL